MAAESVFRRIVHVLWGDWKTNQLWQRILKNSLACTIAVIIAVIPPAIRVFGYNTYLIPMVSVFAHPGQRMGTVVESLAMVLLGSLLGLGWSILGLYLSILATDHSPAGASSLRAVFFLVSVLFHGYMRSHTPRLFPLVWFELLSSASIFLGGAEIINLATFTNVYYPILAGSAVVFIVNLSIFPEHATSYLGASTIESIFEAVDALHKASYWFLTPGGDSDEAKEETKNKLAENGKKKTLISEFLSDFPNPFQTSGSKKPSMDDINLTTIASLSATPPALRARVAQCKTAQNEVNFEFAVSPLAPRSLKPISKHELASLIQNAIILIGACENKFVLLSNDENAMENSDAESDSSDSDLESNPEMESSSVITDGAPPGPSASNVLHDIPEDDKEEESKGEDFQRVVEDVKPLREIESASSELLEAILQRIRDPIRDFDHGFKEATDLLISCLAYCYDVDTLPSGAPTPQGIWLEEIDLRVDAFTEAIGIFDTRCPEELKLAAINNSGQSVDLMPRMEMFLVSSFLLGYRQAASHILEMLRHARHLVEERQKRHNKSRLWIPHYTDIGQWLSTSGEADAMVLPESGRTEARNERIERESRTPTGTPEGSASDESLPWERNDEESAMGDPQRQPTRTLEKPVTQQGLAVGQTVRKGSIFSVTREKVADALEWAQHSEDVIYAVKLAIAVFIVSWPSFVSSWKAWYGEVRGIWAPLQLILVFEVSIGTSLFVFFLRLLGVIFGCTMGLLSYEIGRGNRVAMVFILIIGIVPSVYIQLGTKYVKAGMISITTMSVVALAAVNHTGTAPENFYKRLVAFLAGSFVAIIVELCILPVRARHRLVQSLSSAVRQVHIMHSTVWIGIDAPEVPNFRSHKLNSRFSHARDKAQTALAAAEMFLPFCRKEPRLKGSFKPLEPIYKEIIYVLHQIINRMDNVVDLRKTYGSSILEELNREVYAYRRNVAASNTLILFSVQEALLTWLPLPQFLPSSRIAQSRLINHVRELIISGDVCTVLAPVLSSAPLQAPDDDSVAVLDTGEVDERTARIITERKFLSWNANAAGNTEIIEYLEELVDLTKLLVGVNAFRSGMLEKPKYKDYVQQTQVAEAELQKLASRRSRRVSKGTVASRAGESALAKARAVAAAAASMHGLRRRATQTQAPPAEGLSRTHTATGMEGADEDGIPMSLRRVRSRIERDSVVVRRRGFSTSAVS